METQSQELPLPKTREEQRAARLLVRDNDLVLDGNLVTVPGRIHRGLVIPERTVIRGGIVIASLRTAKLAEEARQMAIKSTCPLEPPPLCAADVGLGRILHEGGDNHKRAAAEEREARKAKTRGADDAPPPNARTRFPQ